MQASQGENVNSQITSDTNSRSWRRVGRIYQITALLVFNAILLFVIFLLIANALFPETSTNTEFYGSAELISVSAPYSARFRRDAYSYMDAEAVEQLLREYDLMAAQGHWQVNPWTGLTLRPFQGSYLNIGQDGERANLPPSDEYAGQPPLTVWAYGGSTMFGWGLADDYSLPSQLQIALQERIPGRQVQVVNYAVPMYTSSQELALFVAHMRQQQPDIAIFMDGVNDVWYAMYAYNQTPLGDPLALAWESQIAQLTTQADQPWLTLNASFPPYRAARALNVPMPAQYIPSAIYAMRASSGDTPEQRLDYALASYRYNRQAATAIAEAYGVATYFFLQPWGNEEYYPAFRDDLMENNDHEHFYDLTGIFTEGDYRGHPLLVDDLHYSDYATIILAERIADVLVEGVN